MFPKCHEIIHQYTETENGRTKIIEFFEKYFGEEIEQERQKARDEGRDEGIIEVSNNTTQNIATSLLKDGMPLEAISRHMKLNISEINALTRT